MPVVTLDPSSGAVLERFEHTAPGEIDAVLARSERGAKLWRTTPVHERAALLQATARTLRENLATLAPIAVREMGKPIAQARAEVEKCASCCEYFSEHGPAMLADRPAESDATRSYVGLRPLGTILAIMPWNFPFWQVFRAAVPALMAGNAMVLKHAHNVTRCALEIERIFTEAGLPPGLFTTVIVADDDVAAIIADRRIAAVTLTGSERAGMSVASVAGSALKKCVLELGGSDAFVVLADADLDAAVSTAITARFQNNGQSCIAAKRFIIEANVYEEFLARFVEATGRQTIGDPMDERTDIGPIARRDVLQSLHQQVQETLESGARLGLGGRVIDRPGNFYEPTVVSEVVPGQPMFDQEVFGPAAAVIRADDAEHALVLANASRYGLGCTIWTDDVGRAEDLARRVEAGSVFINGMVASNPRLPFGGIKRSGYGRELAAIGLQEFTNIQTVWIGPKR